jgi:hypothetical protein
VGKRPLGRTRRRWVDNTRIDIVEVGWGDVDWISLAQGRGIEPSGATKCWETMERPSN